MHALNLTAYIGTKLVNAAPLTLGEYKDFRGWKLLNNEKATDEGYLVEYPGDGKNTDIYKGYVSWSPKHVFEESYQKTSGLSFGMALDAMEKGFKVARNGWNGKGMYIELQIPDANSKMSLPYIYMKTVDNKLVPWLASQTDMLAKDWVLAN